MENKKMNCSNCGAVIEDTYYKCLDNCLQVNFFDTEEENCSPLPRKNEKQLSIFDLEVMSRGN